MRHEPRWHSGPSRGSVACAMALIRRGRLRLRLLEQRLAGTDPETGAGLVGRVLHPPSANAKHSTAAAKRRADPSEGTEVIGLGHRSGGRACWR